VRHTGAWVVRLGDGTDESQQRSLHALDQLWGYTGELFEMTSAEMRLANAGLLPDRAGVKPLWDTAIAQVLREATLPMPPARAMQTGGRAGRHTEHLDHLLAIMQVLPRRYPDARW
jgi:ring-1,2-phenylacetyl-CoA epoxidase subunit PaaC